MDTQMVPIPLDRLLRRTRIRQHGGDPFRGVKVKKVWRAAERVSNSGTHAGVGGVAFPAL